jgi:Asp-tRNA(Asn)/Glu-tRNA(Gln) amidotransferase B subunit
MVSVEASFCLVRGAYARVGLAPLAKGGYLDLAREDVRVHITQIQLEQVCSASRTRSTWMLTAHLFQDTAKSIVDARRRYTQVDLNRAGSGLMEIVSEPDMRSVLKSRRCLDLVQTVLCFCFQVSRGGGRVCSHSPSHAQGRRR